MKKYLFDEFTELFNNLRIEKANLEKKLISKKVYEKRYDKISYQGKIILNKLLRKNNYVNKDIIIESWDLLLLTSESNGFHVLLIWFLNKKDESTYIAVFDHEDSMIFMENSDKIGDIKDKLQEYL